VVFQPETLWRFPALQGNAFLPFASGRDGSLRIWTTYRDCTALAASRRQQLKFVQLVDSLRSDFMFLDGFTDPVQISTDY
jgi:hypothetical protein